MHIKLHNVSKRYNRHWIFRQLSFNFSGPGFYAITGANGTGKSTLLLLLANIIEPTKGQVHYNNNDSSLPAENVYSAVSFSAPAMELPEELTLDEFLRFHFAHKPLQPAANLNAMIEQCGLTQARNKPISTYSSGMKQRVKLMQAFAAHTPFLLLDEPTSNLDVSGAQLFHAWMKQYAGGRLCVIASNDEQEIADIDSRINIMDFK